MKEINLKQLIASTVVEDKAESGKRMYQGQQKEQKEMLNENFNTAILSQEVVANKNKIYHTIEGVSQNINEGIKQQMDSWKYSTFEANQFLKNIYDWQKRYMTFLQKVQEFYDHHPEIAKLTNENANLKNDQDYFEQILDKYQKQADVWYDKLKSTLLLKNSLETMLKTKKKRASQLLIKRINLERVLDSKHQQSESRVDRNIKRGRSNIIKRNDSSMNNSSFINNHSSFINNQQSFINNQSLSINNNSLSMNNQSSKNNYSSINNTQSINNQSSSLLRSLSNKKKSQNLTSVISSTEGSRNVLSINDSIQVGCILPSISPKIKGYQKQKSYFSIDQQKKESEHKHINNSSKKGEGQSQYEQFLNCNMDDKPLMKVEARDLSYLYKLRTSNNNKKRSITEMDVSPIVRNAQRQLATIENTFKAPKPKPESLSSYKNLSYLKDMKKEKQKRILQNSSVINKSISTLSFDESIPNINSIYSRENGNNQKNKYNQGYQDSLSLINQINKTKQFYSANKQERIIHDSSVIYLDQNEANFMLINEQNGEQLELKQINQEIKKMKEEIKNKNKQIQEKSRKFYRIEYFFEECLKCSEKSMMKKIENLQLSGFELNENMEKLLNILDKFDDAGGVKQIVKQQSIYLKNEEEQMLLTDQTNNAGNESDDTMNYNNFKSLTMKQLLFSICRSNQMKLYFTKIMKKKSDLIKNIVNEIKLLLSQFQSINSVSHTHKNIKSTIDSISIKRDSSFLEFLSDKAFICKTSPTQRNQPRLIKLGSKNII